MVSSVTLSPGTPTSAKSLLWHPYFIQMITDQPCLDHGVNELLGQVWIQEEILKQSEGEACSAVEEKVTWPGDVPPTPSVTLHWEEQYSYGHDTWLPKKKND